MDFYSRVMASPETMFYAKYIAETNSEHIQSRIYFVSKQRDNALYSGDGTGHGGFVSNIFNTHFIPSDKESYDNQPKGMVGRYILEEWENNGYVSRSVYRIDRETKTSYVCNKQRDRMDYEDNKDKYVYDNRFINRFRKGRYGEPKRIVTRLSNTDGIMKLSLISDLTELLCPYSFDEIFHVDVRTIQHEDSYPLKGFLRRQIRFPDIFGTVEYFTMGDYCSLHDSSESSDPIMGWDREIVKYLEDTFKVPVYNFWECLNEYNNQSILSKSLINFSILHFGDYKKCITRKENEFNRDIQFWLFKDRLVFKYTN